MIAVVFFLADWWLFSHVIAAVPGFWEQLVFVVLFFIVRQEARAWSWLRSTRLSDLLRTHLYRMAGVLPQQKQIDATNCQTAIEQGRPVIFAIEPHGYQCTAISTLLCGYGTRSNPFLRIYGREFLDNTRVVVHWIHNFFPFIGILFRLFGAIPNTRKDVEDALARGQNIAVVPSGLAGKFDAVSRPVDRNRIHVIRRPGDRYGFLTLAVRYDALVVPILVPDEMHVYTPLAGLTWLPNWLCPVRETWVTHGIARPMRVLFGKAFDSRKFDEPTVCRFATDYYAALASLGNDNGSFVHLH